MNCLSIYPTHAQQVEEIELGASEVANMLNAKVWAFSYKPETPSKSLHLLVCEELTDDKGKTSTTIRKAMWMGMLPDPERVFKIKMCLIDRELRSMISAAGGPPVQLSEHLISGTYEYRRGGPPKPDAQGWRFLMEGSTESVGQTGEFQPGERVGDCFSVLEPLFPRPLV